MASPGPSPALRRDRRRARWRLPRIPLLLAVGALAGVALLMYPTVAAWFSQYAQSQIIDGYSDQIRDLGAGTLADQLDAAREYNTRLVDGGAEIAANERLPLANSPDQTSDYAEQLRSDGAGLMARLKIPSIAVDLPIYHGTSEEVLYEGVGHLEGTALPVGGDTTHSVLTAHRGLATAELFTHLDQVALDDTFTIEVFGEVLTYRVVETQVVRPEDTESLAPVVGRDLVTLVTCTPLGVNSHRILVTGERVIPTPQADIDGAGARPEIPSFPWWILVLAAAVVVAGLYVWWSGRPPRSRRPSPAAPSPGPVPAAPGPAAPGPAASGSTASSPAAPGPAAPSPAASGPAVPGPAAPGPAASGSPNS
ncbi:class C sortase [Microbacterium sp. LMI1-1-1.1]|uniref:class C sortase n=1 Tax=Microbacterium sp. LMI1-1-1.1 TaxID=3135223 RepID=UPI0034663181